MAYENPEIIDIAAVPSETEAAAASTPVRRVLSSMALAATVVLAPSGCSLFESDALSSQEVIQALDGQKNRCFGVDDDRYANCATPTMALAFDPMSGINPRPYKHILKEAFQALTPPDKTLAIKIVPLSGSSAKDMEPEECVQDDRYTYDAANLPVVRAAVDAPTEFTEYDFVMGLTTVESCNTLLKGISTSSGGDRFTQVFDVPTADTNHFKKQLHDSLSFAVHEMGHRIFSLEHVAGDFVPQYFGDEITMMNGVRHIDLDTVLQERGRPYPYGDSDSIMGGGMLPKKLNNLTARQLVTPLEYDDIAFGNRVDVQFPNKHNSVVLQAGKWNQYAQFKLDKTFDWSTKDNGDNTLRYYGLYAVRVQQKSYLGTSVNLYTRAVNDNDINFVLLGEVPNLDRSPVQLSITDDNGIKKLLTIQQEHNNDVRLTLGRERKLKPLVH